jgi:excisionase family DNA binding protein
MEKMYSVDQVAEMFHVSQACVRKWVFMKRIPYQKIGRFVRFSESDLEAMVKPVPDRKG